jgi:peptide/nickel transport system permease protein
MVRFLARRALSTIIVMVFVTSLVFGLTLLIPGDAAEFIGGQEASAQTIERIREQMGLNRSVVDRYARWISGLAQGDLGTSLYSSQRVCDAILSRLPATLSLAAAAILLALLISIPAGIIAALFKDRAPDHAVGAFTSLGIAVPSFWLGAMLVLIFAVKLGWFPALGYVPITKDVGEWAHRLVLPALTLSLTPAVELTRQMRGAMLEVLGEDYIRVAHAKGMPLRTVLLKHGLKNAALGVVTLTGLQFAYMLSGAVIVERVFGINGIGTLALDAVVKRDITMLQGAVVVAAIVVMVSLLFVDIISGVLNPRLRVSNA